MHKNFKYCSYCFCKNERLWRWPCRHSIEFWEFQMIALNLICGNQPPAPPPGTAGVVASGGYASKAAERTALQVARAPGAQPLMSDSSAARPTTEQNPRPASHSRDLIVHQNITAVRRNALDMWVERGSRHEAAGEGGQLVCE
jgi:hypothetical protein